MSFLKLPSDLQCRLTSFDMKRFFYWFYLYREQFYPVLKESIFLVHFYDWVASRKWWGSNWWSFFSNFYWVKVSNDGKLPRSICGSCRDGVDASKVFFDVLVAGQRRLRELWKEQVGLAFLILFSHSQTGFIFSVNLLLRFKIWTSLSWSNYSLQLLEWFHLKFLISFYK